MTDAERLASWLEHKRIAVLTGAGCSTESGIPDYRGPETARRARTPIQGRSFATDPLIRARYWARALVGFRRFAGARPNAAHRALAALEERGTVRGIITQNVDGLHGAAGSRRVVELHGSLAEVACLDCGSVEPRARVQERLESQNPGLLAAEGAIAPDGDADLPDEWLRDFVVPACLSCAGRIKPRVVFFGENVAKPVVDAAFDLLTGGDAGAEGLLVVGTSLAVFSGYRFVLRAKERGIPMCFVNLGRARGDDLAELRFDARAGSLLGAAVAT